MLAFVVGPAIAACAQDGNDSNVYGARKFCALIQLDVIVSGPSVPPMSGNEGRWMLLYHSCNTAEGLWDSRLLWVESA